MTGEGLERKCPLCGEDNGCQHGETSCWCQDYVFPQELLDRIPEDKKRKACICKSCVEKYIKK